MGNRDIHYRDNGNKENLYDENSIKEKIVNTEKIREWLKSKGYLDKGIIDKRPPQLAEEYINDKMKEYENNDYYVKEINKKRKEYMDSIRVIIWRILKKNDYRQMGDKWINAKKIFNGIYKIDQNKLFVYNPILLRFILEKFPDYRILFFRDLIDNYMKIDIKDANPLSSIKALPYDLEEYEEKISAPLIEHMLLNEINIPPNSQEFIKTLESIMGHIRRQLKDKNEINRLKKYYLALVLLYKFYYRLDYIREGEIIKIIKNSLQDVIISALSDVERILQNANKNVMGESNEYFYIFSKIFHVLADNADCIKGLKLNHGICLRLNDIYEYIIAYIDSFKDASQFNEFIKELIRCENALKCKEIINSRTSPEGSQEVKNDEKQH